MNGLHYPDNLYADALSKVRAVTGKPTGAYDGRGAGSPPYKPGHGYVADPVTKPAHYQRAGIETIDYIRATLSAPGFEAYCIGNVLKYVSRYREKGGVEDLRKAQVYLGWAINPKTDSFNPAAQREAKIAYDTSWDRARGPITLDELITANPALIGDVPHERVPKWSPEWATHWVNPTPQVVCVHPMNAEAIRDHDERLSGAEDRL